MMLRRMWRCAVEKGTGRAGWGSGVCSRETGTGWDGWCGLWFGAWTSRRHVSWRTWFALMSPCIIIIP